MIVWKLGAGEEAALSAAPPLQPPSDGWPQPWILHMLEVNTMNFCSFTSLPVATAHDNVTTEMLIAVPNTLQSEAVGDAFTDVCKLWYAAH